MSVKIRLRRTGKRNAACHRIVVADSRSPRDGRFIEIIGVYDPRHEFERIDLERADYWISHGAQPSETVASIIKRAKEGGAKPAPAAPAAAPAPEKEA
ncbi:MAG: 30S ribosomal protein S16 [Victivallales bacterium]|nr:30S ribosomal protein S16 [Victivallales bacterium]